MAASNPDDCHDETLAPSPRVYSRTAVFTASHASLEPICHFVTRAAAAAGLSEAETYAAQAATDEACANIINHAYSGEPDGEIQITCLADQDVLTIILGDHGKPFDLTKVPEPNVGAGLDDRPVGGLGLYLIRQWMDEVFYEHVTPKGHDRRRGANVLTLVKRTGSGSPPASAPPTTPPVSHLSLVREVSAQIANVLDLDELSRRVTHAILTTFRYYYVAIFTLEPQQALLHFRDCAGPLKAGEERRIPPIITIRLGQGIIGTVAQTGQEIVACRVSDEPLYKSYAALPETRSEVALPLKISERVLGVLDVQSDQPDAFSDTDMLVLHALADNIAVAVESAQLYSALHRRADQLASVAEVSSAITSILNLDELLDEVVRLIRERLGADFVQVFTVHPGRRKIFYETGSNADRREMRAAGFHYELDDPQGSIPLAARSGEIIQVASQQERSEIVVPLLFGKEVLGILDVQSEHANAFDEEDRLLLEALADNVAIALRNASLYRAERWRRQVAESMREVAGLLSADSDLEHVLDGILTSLEQGLPCDAAAIWLLGDASTTDDPATLYLAAVHSSNPQIPADDIMDACCIADLAEASRVPLEWLAVALHAEAPITRNASSPFEPLGAFLGCSADYSALAAPLRIADRPLGLLSLVHRTSGRYGSEARTMAATLASYAAVAIENTRLYEASNEQAWIATVLLQVAEATQAITDLHELAATVVEVTPKLVGVDACALFLWDEHSEVFAPVASYGLPDSMLDLLNNQRFSPQDYPAFAELQQFRQITLFSLEEEEHSSLVALPLTARGEVLGALLVKFNKRNGSSDTPTIEDILADERSTILQGIAHQTAIAIENIQLLKAQKDEAYISVALLQVAQAIVSLNNLNDILATIVRIMPILVGIKRCAVFVRGDEGNFRLVQSYGIPRNMEDALTARPYAIENFPMLEAVCARDGVVYFPMDQITLSPDQWDRLVPPEADISGEPPENSLGFPSEVLQSRGSLLLGFPLSIKGNVLAVMLVEEADPGVDESPVHIRQRRLEIITGITQQAALAIQNEHLQRDVVERERLDRELQLAREIQQTFLPRRLPKLPGWDLDVRWRPARQVAGDFYDVISLPNGRLGLVVADVADKGIPASLFMTLIRTLMRAAIQSENSPSAVLERVNDLLVPDTENGMFVTLVYAVLDPVTGRLDYANAGHNLPLHVQATTGAIERLKHCGMALGVLEGIHIEEHSVWMNTGDVVIFYTDGVTETFSGRNETANSTNDGAEEMFGEERLQQLLRNNRGRSARSILNAIDRAVISFGAEAYLSDDLTMIALKRRVPRSRSPVNRTDNCSPDR